MSWPRFPLARVARAAPADREFLPDENVWHLTLDQIESGSGRIVGKQVAPASAAGSSNYVFDSGNVLYSKLRPYLNKVVKPTEAGIATTELVPLRPDPDVLCPEFLAHYLRSPSFAAFASGCVAGVKMPRIIMAKFWEHEVPLPPPSEQRRIVEILDQTDRLRRLRAGADAKAERILPALFIKMFGDPAKNPKGWRTAQVEQIADVQGGLQLSGQRRGSVDLPYLRVANVYRDRLDLSEIKLLSLTPAELDRTRLISGDVLVVEGHGNPAEIGRCAVWDGSIDPCVHQNHLIRIRVDRSQLTPHFLSRCLNSPSGRQQLFRSGKTTSGLNTINVSNVRAVLLFLPPLELQQRFEEAVAGMANTRERTGSASGALDRMWSLLLAGAFSGSLTAQWRESHMKELREEMEQQARTLANAR